MKIANPLYDTAFKYLMENNKLAIKIISLIIEEEIEELHMENQEHVFVDESRMLRLFRVDFKAVIRLADGTRQKVLIELQKSKSEAEVRRFRRYLGANYMKSDTEKNSQGIDVKVAYPIITIYLLGYPLEDVPHVAVTINNTAVDAVTGEPVAMQSLFMRLLTHRSHILQVARLGQERRSRLEQFLSLFSQQWKTADGYVLDIKEVPQEFRDIADYLSIPLRDENFLEQALAEEEIEQRFAEKEKKLEQALKEKEEALKEKEKEREEKEKALSAIAHLAKRLAAKGITPDEIANDTGLTTEEVNKILDK
ncbi:MAG: hypothetical protein JXR39_00245 [Marinilabiliaceae bacterium]|nr:hypothetical protein [Marinilabiliaceae bacterium]